MCMSAPRCQLHVCYPSYCILIPQIKRLVESVQPFDQLAFKSHQRLLQLSGARRRGLDVIESCGRQLLQDLQLNGCATGLDINIQVH